ncbi:DUF5681 domain-containing protein [Sphingomonas sp.]|uniref:DUF5681 domain-containing protein n=1 Tax=Sphingomonas sp. TaxID=28214 RepID=UPI00344C3F30
MGYGRPPLHSRFRPGYSGNPAGRRKGSEDHSKIIRRVALRRVLIDGRLTQKRNIDLLLEVVRRAAAKGDFVALSLVRKYTGFVETEESPIPKGILIVGEKLTQEEWKAEYGHLGRPPASAAPEATKRYEDERPCGEPTA